MDGTDNAPQKSQPKIRYGQTREEMCHALMIHRDVFRRFLRDIGIHHSNKLLPREVQLIREEFGVEYM